MTRRYLLTVTAEDGRVSIDVDRIRDDYPVDYAEAPLGGTGDSTGTLSLRQLLREASAIIGRDLHDHLRRAVSETGSDSRPR